jgi:hypothetical protein
MVQGRREAAVAALRRQHGGSSRVMVRVQWSCLISFHTL